MNSHLRTQALERLALATDSALSDDKIALYIENTTGFSDDTFVKACRALELTATWFPKCAELREACIAARPAEMPIQRPDFTPLSPERAAYWLGEIRKAAGIRDPKVKP